MYLRDSMRFFNVVVLLSSFWLVLFADIVSASNHYPSITEFYLSDPTYLSYNIENSKPEEENRDPLEKINRVFFKFNNFLDFVVINPLSTIYITLMPDPLEKNVSNFFRNLSAPITIANDILQFRFERASVSFWRFILNSTFGVFGFWDIAEKEGLLYHLEDFGQTLRYYKSPSGFYLVLPIIGPSTSTDFVGKIGDYLIDPVRISLSNVNYQRLNSVRVVVKRSENSEVVTMINNSLDPYIAMRSMYMQNRNNQSLKD